MILKISQLKSLRKSLSDKKIVVGGGTFDLLHIGHISFFRELKKYGDVVVIAISSDKRTEERKGKGRPVISEKERLVMIDAVRYVDYVVLAPKLKTETTRYPTMRILEVLKPDVFVTSDKRFSTLSKYFNDSKISLKVIPRLVKKVSTSRIIDKILSQGKDTTK